MYQSAKFNFIDVDKGYFTEQWSKNYKTETKVVNGKAVPMTASEIKAQKDRANRDLFLVSNKDIPSEAVREIDLVSSAFDGDNNFTKEQITEILGAIGFVESKFKEKEQRKGGPARSYWQIEPKTAESILDQNLNVMKGGGSPFLGANFEKLFRSKYANQIGSGTALEYFASLNRKELSNLLLKDGLFAASMAAHKVVTTFDPFNSKGA